MKYVPSLVSLTCPSSQILGQIQTRYCRFPDFPVNLFYTKICDDIEIKLVPVTRQCQKKLTMTSCRQIVESFLFFQFMVNLEQSRSRISDGWSIILTFCSIVTPNLTKNEKRTNKLLTELSYYYPIAYCFEQRLYFFLKNADFCQKKFLISGKLWGCWY